MRRVLERIGFFRHVCTQPHDQMHAAYPLQKPSHSLKNIHTSVGFHTSITPLSFFTTSPVVCVKKRHMSQIRQGTYKISQNLLSLGSSVVDVTNPNFVSIQIARFLEKYSHIERVLG